MVRITVGESLRSVAKFRYDSILVSVALNDWRDYVRVHHHLGGGAVSNFVMYKLNDEQFLS